MAKPVRYDSATIENLRMAQTSAAGYLLEASNTSGDMLLKDARYIAPPPNFTFGGRLTVSSSLSVADGSAITTLYYLPHVHQYIPLYDDVASRWKMVSFTSISLSLSGIISGTVYDIVCYLSGGSPVLATYAWTNATTRATSLTRLGGLWYVSSLDPTSVYLGTIRASANNQTQDTELKRFVYNAYNRVQRKLFTPGVGTQSLGTSFAAWSSAAAIEIVQGLDSEVDLEMSTAVQCGNSVGVTPGISYDTNNTQAADMWNQLYNVYWGVVNARLRHQPSIGYHYYYPIMRGDSGSVGYYQNSIYSQGGMLGHIAA